jgi:hypothetical protein
MKKNKIKDIDIDFMGGMGPLTTEEELALSEYFRKQKQERLEKGKKKIG